MLEKGVKGDARKRLEAMEKEFASGKVDIMPPKEFEEFIVEYEHLVNCDRGFHPNRFCC